MPTGSCDPATRGETHNQVTLERPAPNGSGALLIDIRWDWDGTSVRPTCDGPILSIRTRNTSTLTCWALLPNKKVAPLWVQLDPGTDVTVPPPGNALTNLGLTKYTDVGGVTFTFTQPA